MIDEYDIGLMCHELGHALAQAYEGAALSVIRPHGESGAISTGLTIQTSGPEEMESTVSTTVAGPAFTIMLDRRFSKIDPDMKLKAGAGMIMLCAEMGIAEHDLEDLKGLGAFRETETEIIARHSAHLQMRRWMMIALAHAPAWRVLAEHIAREVAEKGACGLPGANLRGMLDETQRFSDMARFPGMFVTDDSLANIVKAVPTMCPKIEPADIVPMLTAPTTTAITGRETVLLS